MQQYPLVRRRNLEDRAHLGRTVALDVAQSDHDALPVGQVTDRRVDPRAHLPPLDLGVHRRPGPGEFLPVPRVRILRATEACRVDRWTVVGGGQAGDRYRPALLDTS